MQEWEWSEQLRRAAGDPALPQPRRRPLRPAPQHPVQHPGHRRRTTTRRPAAGRSRPTRATASRRSTSSPPSAACRRTSRPTFPGLDDFQGEWYHTGALAPRGRRLHRQAGRRDRHRLDRRAVDPGDRRAGRPPLRVPAHRRTTTSRRATARSTRRSSTRSRPTTTEHLARRRASRAFGLPYTLTERSALVGQRRGARARSSRGRWDEGGFQHRLDDRSTTSSSTSGPTTPPPSSSGDKIRETGERPGRRRDARARRPPVRRPSGRCIDTDYYDTYNRDNVTLVDIRHAPIEEITPTRRAHRRGRVRARRHRVRHRLRRDDRDPVQDGHPGARRREAEGQVGPRPAHLPRPRHRRLPEPVHDHRAESPSVLSQHAGVDRAALGLDRGCDRALPGRRRRLRGSDPGGRGRLGVPSQRAGRCHPAAGHQLVVGRRQHPGKVRTLYPYVGGVGTFRHRCQEVADKGYEGFNLAQRSTAVAGGQ